MIYGERSLARNKERDRDWYLNAEISLQLGIRRESDRWADREISLAREKERDRDR